MPYNELSAEYISKCVEVLSITKLKVREPTEHEIYLSPCTVKICYHSPLAFMISSICHTNFAQNTKLFMMSTLMSLFYRKIIFSRTIHILLTYQGSEFSTSLFAKFDLQYWNYTHPWTEKNLRFVEKYDFMIE